MRGAAVYLRGGLIVRERGLPSACPASRKVYPADEKQDREGLQCADDEVEFHEFRLPSVSGPRADAAGASPQFSPEPGRASRHECARNEAMIGTRFAFA